MHGKHRRTNGWQRPYHPLQVMTWLLLPVFIALFYSVCVPNLGSVALQASFGTVTGVLGVVTCTFAFTAAYIDPAVPSSTESGSGLNQFLLPQLPVECSRRFTSLSRV